MTKILLGCCLLLGLSAAGACAQSFVQISSVRAFPNRLTCVGPGARSRVRVQIYLAGVPEAAKQSTASVNLSVYSAHPSTSKIDIRDATKDVPLTDSPALVDFEVTCTSETLPGSISLSATIVTAPDGILIKEPVAQPVVELQIERPH